MFLSSGAPLAFTDAQVPVLSLTTEPVLEVDPSPDLGNRTNDDTQPAPSETAAPRAINRRMYGLPSAT